MDFDFQQQRKKVNALWGNIFTGFGISGKDSHIEILKHIPLFKDLSRYELNIITKAIYERNFSAGEYLFEAGQPGASMFIIREGEVQIIQPSPGGEDVELARLSDGEFLGELALLDNSPRSASAFTVKPTKTLAIFRSDLDKLLKTHPALGGKVMKKLAIIIGIRLKATNALITQDEEGNGQPKS